MQLSKSLPQISGELMLKGLSEQVEIYRDQYGIPHIYAHNRNDLMFAVGFVSAQERLWQMDLTRRVATGRLAEIFGEDVIELDLVAHIMGFGHTSGKQFELLSPETAGMLQAYSNGINECVRLSPALPLEFRILNYRPAPWQPTDSLAISRLLAWQLSKNFESELVMLKLANKLGVDRAAELGPTYPAEGPFITSVEIAAKPIQIQYFEKGARLLDDIIGSSGGSNSWVIGSSLTENGRPILANDPHLSGTRVPSIWYFVHIVGDGFDVAGALVPGLPLPLLGHNRSIGWGMTNMTVDIQDIFIERINPANPDQYEYDGAWVDMEKRTERIRFRTTGGDMSFIETDVKSTIHGPVVNELSPGIVEAITLSWTGLEPTPDFEAVVGINLATNWEEFCRALSKFSVAPQNIIYADVEGNIGYYGAGIIPIRSAGNGVMPQDGWTSETRWAGYIPFEELPHIFNPRADYIVTANNQVIRNDYKHFLSAYWAPGFRYKRIAELIEGNAPHDVASVARMQMDSKSLLAESLLPYVLAALLAESEPVSNEAIGYLQEWDRHNTKDSVAATVYHEFLLRFARNTFVDEMGQKLAEEYLADYYLWLERFMLLIKENSSWFDDVRTEVVETRDEIAVRSFKEALAALERRLGRNMADWQWGRVHQIQFPHPLSRGSRLARRFFNLGPFQFPGDGESINRGTFAFNEPYDVTMAASLRHVMDFSDLGSILAIHPTGQSGNFMSDRYDDFLDMWLNGTYATMTTDREDILDDADGYLRLIPFEHTSSP
jgi:penicillin amidase